MEDAMFDEHAIQCAIELLQSRLFLKGDAFVIVLNAFARPCDFIHFMLAICEMSQYDMTRHDV